MIRIIPQNPGHDDTDICNPRKTSDFDMEILIDAHIHDIEINITAIFLGCFFQVILIFRAITVDKNMEDNT